MLADVTLQEIADLVEGEIAGGYESEKQEGRRRLRAVVTELSEDEPDCPHDLIQDRSWRLSRADVSGIGGIAMLDPGPLELAPTRGVTLVRGDNGCGKTSLARGIECGLHGRSDLAQEVAGSLWAAQLIADGDDTATVHLALSSEDGGRMTIEAELTDGVEPTMTAVLADADGERAVVALDDAWRRAVTGARACYSYGVVQNRLTQNKDLQDFLEELLVLGPVWQRVRDRLSRRAEAARGALRAVEDQRKKAVAREKELRTRWASDPREPVPPPAVIWPRAKDGADAERWLEEAGFVDVVAPGGVLVAADHEAQVEALDARLAAADDALATAEAELDSPALAAALHHIEQLAAADGLADGTCPLCGSAADWRTHARELSHGLAGRSDAARDVQEAVSALTSWVESELVPLIATAEPGGPDAAVAALREVTAAGHHAHSAAHQRCRPLLDALRSDEHGRWLATLRERSSATAEWRAELAAVARDFADCLRAHSTSAAEAGVWKKAEETLDELQVALRQDRQDAVTAQLHDVLSRLLPDAAIELRRITHAGGAKQQRGVGVEITIGGRVATLGMLSSGQRNALLLAPLLILDQSPTVELLVVDDPVHALDDVRVDLLARELARLGEVRQVVVLTHDARLEEYLRARVPELDLITLERDPTERSVRWVAGTPWKTLLDDALEVSRNADKEGWDYSESVDNVVAGLCRTALDGALRQAVIMRAAQLDEQARAALGALEERHDTRSRVKHVLDLAGGSNELPALEEARANHLGFWNRGSHGQLPSGVDVEVSVAAAAAACSELVAHDWRTA